MENKTIEISMGTLIKGAAVVLLLWFLYLIQDIIALFFLSVILTATLDPIIDWMGKHKISRSIGVVIIYLLLFTVIGLLAFLVIPPLVSQFQDFGANIPAYSEKLTQTFGGIETYAESYGINFNSHEFLQGIFGNIFQTSGKIFSTTVGVFAFFISILVILALTFYMSVKEDGMNIFLLSVTPADHQGRVIAVANRIKRKIGKWLGGQLLLMLIIFVLDFIALSIFHVPYALILALLAGMLEIVPYLGPIISAGLASLVGFLISPVTGLLVLGILTVIQQIESHIIVPQVMKKAVGLNPVVVILSLLIGAKLAGTLGAVLAVPIATSIGVIVEDFFDKTAKTN